MTERNFSVVGKDYKPNGVSEEVDLDKVDPTLFAKKYPKFLKYLLARKDNIRFDFSIATMRYRIADVQRTAAKHALGDFFSRSPYHEYVKFMVTKHAFERVREGSSRLGIPISDLKILYPSKSPGERTKDKIINEAIENGYLLKTKSLKGNLQIVVPTDVFIAAHFIENRARLERLYSSGIIDILLQAKGEIDDVKWLPDLEFLISEEDQKMLNFRPDEVD